MNPNEKLIDSHVHVFDPVRFPYASDAWYHPVSAETAPAAQLGHVLDAHGVQHALIVGPNSGYNLDNRCLLDASVVAIASSLMSALRCAPKRDLTMADAEETRGRFRRLTAHFARQAGMSAPIEF